jgi:hypothetical protein
MSILCTNKVLFLLFLSLVYESANVNAMNLKEAELLWGAGALQTPVIKKYTGGDEGWVVTLNGKHKLNATLETARGEVRVFKRLDVAVDLLFGLGALKVEVLR